MGDVKITFAGTVEVPGRVEYIHPLHNLAVISYNPELVGDTPVRSAVFSPQVAEEGDEIWVAGLKGNSNPFIQKSQVAAVDAVGFPLSRTLRFRDTNLETIAVVNAPGNVDGVLLDSKGRVMATWSSFAFEGANKKLEQVTFGIAGDLVEEMVGFVREGRDLHSLETELRLLPLATARDLGLPAERIKGLEKHSPQRRQALQVVRTVAGSPAAGVLRPGDLLLAIDGELVNTYREVERRVQQDEVSVTLWRNGEELTETLRTQTLTGHGVDRIVYWAGAVLQTPHRALPAQRGILPEGVYVAYFAYGSPASRYSLWAGRRIIEIDGQPTPDLDSFVAAVANKSDRESVRIKTVTWNDQVEVLTLKTDHRYWPAYELRRVDDQWRRSPIGPAPAVAGGVIDYRGDAP
jgi:S1-C subfamily serine protease